MKNLIRFAVAGALVAGASLAQAQVALPNSGNADLWLFVSDTATQQTFAEDTGLSLSSLLPTGSLVPNASLSTAITPTIDFNGGSALANFISTSGASNLEWGVEGAQYPTTGPTNSNDKVPGNFKGIYSTGALASKTTAMAVAGLNNWGAGFNGDMTSFISSTYQAGGTVYAFAPAGSTTNVWGASSGPVGGSTTLYNNGGDQAGIGIGQSVAFYGLTGNNSLTGKDQSYVLGSLSLSSTGVLATASPVPLPAAVWLFGSGLLGLVGIGRRRGAPSA